MTVDDLLIDVDAPPKSSLVSAWNSFGDLAPVDVQGWFGNDHPLELDIGCGQGLFLVREGQRRPKVNFLGVDWMKKNAVASAERAVKKGLQNVRVLSVDLRLFIHRFSDGQFSGLHLYFPDPWWKRRHKKRRIVTDDFLKQLARVLKSEGYFHIATDVEEYFLKITDLMAQQPAFTQVPNELFEPANASEQPNLPDGQRPQHDLAFLTHFDRKYRRQGRPIYRSHYQRLA